MAEPETRIRRWLDDCVLALDLCPFARPVVADGSLRIAVCQSANHQLQLQAFLEELDRIQRSPESEISTTLLVLAAGEPDFEDFLALVDSAQALLETAGLEGVIQLAHFHPNYLFADESPDQLSHFTNRSPLPVIHLLRESTLTRVLANYPDPESIPRRNIQRLESLGREALAKIWAGLG